MNFKEAVDKMDKIINYESFDPDKYPSLDLSLEELRRALREQIESIDVIDDKIGLVLGFSGVIISMLLGTNAKGLVSSGNFSLWSFSLLIGAIFFVLIGSGINIVVYRAKDYSAGPEPEDFFYGERFTYVERDPEWVKARLASSYARSYEENEKIVERKEMGLRWSVPLLYGGLFLTAVRFACKMILEWV